LPRVISVRPFRRKVALGLVAGLALVLGLSACGGGETTVTVTETVESPAKQSGKTDASKLQLEEGVVAGYADHVKTEGDSLVLNGWAASNDLTEPATQVAAVVGGKTVGEAVPTLNRQDVVEALGKPGLKDSGFELRLPLDSLDCGAPAAGIEIVATLEGKSGVLNFGEGVKEEVSDAC
jgi:hypothetical protein